MLALMSTPGPSTGTSAAAKSSTSRIEHGAGTSVALVSRRATVTAGTIVVMAGGIDAVLSPAESPSLHAAATIDARRTAVTARTAEILLRSRVPVPTRENLPMPFLRRLGESAEDEEIDLYYEIRGS